MSSNNYTIFEPSNRMRMKNNIFFWGIFILFPWFHSAQSTKTLQAVRTDKAPVIDGKKDEVWNQAEMATGFVMMEPGQGQPEPELYKTTVRLLYDDAALYILAEMKVPDVKQIVREFSLRDQFSMSDWFSVMLNPFLAPGNTYVFVVTSAGTQMDGIQSSNNTDLSWNAVWKSEVRITDKAWYVEMAIPYSALRFENRPDQTWGITFIRSITHTREQYSWTLFDKTKEGDVVQFLGRLQGLKNLKPPVRLSLYPYASMIHTRAQNEQKTDFAFGADLKYGLTENFTLDATLIPDFSDVPYDDVVLNLGPFEQFYSENRPFFTEGTQLFSKGDLFYSRRIGGGLPMDYYKVLSELSPGEIIVENPENINLLNAVKISGRTAKGVGVGFLNAVTNQSFATIKDTITGKTRQIRTQPYVNYNVAVVDYAFGKNNSVALINTNTLRAGHYPDANATAFVFDLYNKNNTFEVSGKAAMSAIHTEQTQTGFEGFLELKKTIKQHSFGTEFSLQDDKYNINDLGFNPRNNLVIYDFFYRYRMLQPTKHFNRFSFSMDVGLDHLYKPYLMYRKDLGYHIFLTTKKYLSFGTRGKIISKEKDYYEPRLQNQYYLKPARYRLGAFISTDYRKKLAGDFFLYRVQFIRSNEHHYGFGASLRFKFTSRFKMIYRGEYKRNINQKGFVTFLNDPAHPVLFGNRQRKTVSNALKADYFFNVKSAFSLSLRHYWSPVHYNRFYLLENDGTLTPTTHNQNHDFNFNVWNLDLGYTWEYAPGSTLTILYRNSLTNADTNAFLTFGENLDNLFMQPQTHRIVIKTIFYIDYNTVKQRWF